MAHEVVDFSLFKWETIAKVYRNIYEQIMQEEGNQ